jgi:hypothetical protein
VAESDGDAHATLHDKDQWQSRDRGLWQINDHWHPDVSDSCAYNKTCNAQNAYIISSSGTNFSLWTTFQQKMYVKFLDIAEKGCKKIFD